MAEKFPKMSQEQLVDYLEQLGDERKRRERVPDPEYQEMIDTMWQKPSEEESEQIETRASERREAQRGYMALRSAIDDELRKNGIDDFELYGAGEHGERLSPLEYQGALRVIGPADESKVEGFVKIIQNLARSGGYVAEMDRPPSVTHAFGQTIKNNDPPILRNRPIFYIYKRYRTGWPSASEREMASAAGVSDEERRKMWGVLRFYESRMSQIASEITEDPHDFSLPLYKQITTQICTTPEFKVVREEMQDASQRNMHLRRSIHMPVNMGDFKVMVYFLAESKGGLSYIDLLGCPHDIKENAIVAISKLMLTTPA